MLVVCVFASALGGLIICLLVLRDVFWPATDHAPRTDLDLQISKVGHVIAAACFAMTALLAVILVARTPLRAAAQPQVSAPDVRVTERLTALERDRARLTALERDRAELAEQVSALGVTMQTLREQVTAMDGGAHGMRMRLDQAETRMAKAESGLTSAETGLKRLSEEMAQAAARARQAERSAATKPIVVGPREMVVPAAPPAPPPPPPPPPPQRRTEVEPSIPPAAPPAPATQVAPAPIASQPPLASTPPKPAAKAATAKPAPSAAASAPRDAPGHLSDKVKNDWSVIRRGFESLGDDFSAAMRDFGRRATGHE